jgi:hypothetical protein
MKVSNIALALCCIFILGACSQKSALNRSYDFDHNVNFEQKKLDNGQFFINVISNDKTGFNRLATFLLRHSYTLCGSYDFKIEVLNGIEQVDERRVSPSYIQPNLSANIECPKNK